MLEGHITKATSLNFQRTRIRSPRTLDILFETSLFVIALAFVLTHPWGHAYVGESQFGDAAYWDLAGEGWARGYITADAPDIRAGYSLFIGIIYSLTGVDFKHVFVAQAILMGIATVLAFHIGRALAGRFAGLLCGLSLALNSYLTEWAAMSTTETLGSICNLAALYFLFRALTSPYTLRHTIGFASLLAYANIVRPLTLLFLIPAVLVLLLGTSLSWQKKVASSAALFVTIAIILGLGMAFQYWRTGEASLSSNTAANFFAASSPKYKVWTGEMYDEVASGLKDRGVPITGPNLNAEFWRLTVQNYLRYPSFQFQRIAKGVTAYTLFEGERERPDRYWFLGPYILVVGLWIIACLQYRNKQHGIRRVLGISILIILFPVLSLVLFRIVGVLSGLQIFHRHPRRAQVIWGLLSIYWLLVGLSQALVGGTEGFLLHRLYTQVEPVNIVLVVLGCLQFVVWKGFPRRSETFPMPTLSGLVRRFGRLPRPLNHMGLALATISIILLLIGTVRMTLANATSDQLVAPFPIPDVAQMEQFEKELDLQGPMKYLVDSKDVDEAIAVLTQSKLPQELTSFAVPGQFSRFFWFSADQEFTQFWFFPTSRPRPDSLDHRRLWAEVESRLRVSDYRDKFGMLILSPTNPFFIRSGDPREFNLINVRAFVPWDPRRNEFAFEQTIRFPLSVRLFDPTRLALSSSNGQVKSLGIVQVNAGGPALHTLSLTPTSPTVTSSTHEATITFPPMKLLPEAQFRSYVSFHPRLFGQSGSLPATAEVSINLAGESLQLAQRLLKGKSEAAEQHFLPFNLSLAEFAGRSVQLTLRVIGTNEKMDMDEVLWAEPKIVVP